MSSIDIYHRVHKNQLLNLFVLIKKNLIIEWTIYKNENIKYTQANNTISLPKYGQTAVDDSSWGMTVAVILIGSLHIVWICWLKISHSINIYRAGRVAQVVECPLSKAEALQCHK
jgi:hypothetical protein